MRADRGAAWVATAGPIPDDGLVRSARFWLRAYPRRWRAVRGEELLGVVIDLARPGERRVRGRDALDLLRGGWATRWREHPPLHTWLLYRFFDRRIPAGYRVWALDDIDGALFPARAGFIGSWAIPLIWLLQEATGGGPPAWFWLLLPVLAVLSLFIGPEKQRRKARLKHIAPQPGERLFEGALVTMDAPAPRVQAVSMLPWAAAILAVTGALAMATALLAPKVLLLARDPNALRQGGDPGTQTLVVVPTGDRWVVAVAILVAALAAGALGALVARRRLRRLLPARPDQPHRVTHTLTATGKTKLVFWSGVIAALAWCEVTGRVVLGPSLILGTAALVLLPGTLVAVGAARRAGDPNLAISDVWSIGARGRAPEVDQPGPALRPLPGPVPDGMIAVGPLEEHYPELP